MILRSWTSLGATLGAALGAALGVACGREAPASDGGPSSSVDSTAGRPAPSEAPTVVFLGTSLTAGLGLDPDQAYPALVQRKIDAAGLGFRVVNAGVSGETSAGSRRQAEWL